MNNDMMAKASEKELEFIEILIISFFGRPLKRSLNS